MIWLGYMAGQAFGWSQLTSFYAGAAISISSTTIIVKAFEEQRIKGDFTHIVFGILIVEDLIAILLITILTTLSSRRRADAHAACDRRPAGWPRFSSLLIVVGLLTVPRLIRLVVRLDRPETTVVASVGLAFGFALLAATVRLLGRARRVSGRGLVAESGVEKKVEHLVQPVRDIFAAIFFVSVGMLIDPAQIVEHWPIVLRLSADRRRRQHAGRHARRVPHRPERSELA